MRGLFVFLLHFMSVMSCECVAPVLQTEELVMLVDDSISRGGSLVASTAPGEKGGNISLLDLPMEREGREYCCCRTCPLRRYAALLYYTGWLGG
jgi:hypothetical protein